MKPLLCTECKKQIRQKSELVVSLKLIQPYHKNCLEHPKSRVGKLQKFNGKFPTGGRFWLMLLLGNALLAEVIRRTPESVPELVVYGALGNLVYLTARLIIYYSYEKKLS